MFKCKLADALAVAAALGYAGEKNAKAVGVFLAEKNPANVTGADGKAIDFKALEIEDDAAKSLTLPVQAVASDPPDLGVKIKAEVDAALKSYGVGPGPKRPALIDDTTKVTNVKSAEQAVYEMQAASGKNLFGTGRVFFDTYEKAKACSHWLAGRVAHSLGHGDVASGHFKSMGKYLGTDGQKAYETVSPNNGSALMPEGFVPDLIRNVLEYGTARKIGKVIQMPEAEVTIPRRTAGISLSYPNENTAPTGTNATYDNVTLKARTGMVLAQASRQILQDSAIGLMELTMEEIALAVATQEDNNFFIGDGSSTYAGITGFENKYGVTATDGGYVVVGGADASAHTDGQVNAAFARLPQYARSKAVITCSPALSSVIFGRLAQSSPGGLTFKEIEGLGWVAKWRGVPIIENNSMSTVTDAAVTNRSGFTAGDQIDFLLGDFSRAALIGDRLAIEIMVDPSAGFTTNSVYIRGIVRHDVNVHSVGTSSAAGPVVSFWQT